jgi:hypothetical protein
MGLLFLKLDLSRIIKTRRESSSYPSRPWRVGQKISGYYLVLQRDFLQV